MSQLSADTVLARGTDHVETTVGDQIMMMSISQGKYFAIADTARRIWQMIETPTRLGDVVDRLVEEYEVAPDQCDRDVRKFAAELVENGLLVESPDGSSV